MSPQRKRLRSAYRAGAESPDAIAMGSVGKMRFRAWAKLVAIGLLEKGKAELREDARTWCLRKWPAPRPAPPWGADVQRCTCCRSAPCDGSRLGCRTSSRRVHTA